MLNKNATQSQHTIGGMVYLGGMCRRSKSTVTRDIFFMNSKKGTAYFFPSL